MFMPICSKLQFIHIKVLALPDIIYPEKTDKCYIYSTGMVYRQVRYLFIAFL
jgi:hypothetical protein